MDEKTSPFDMPLANGKPIGDATKEEVSASIREFERRAETAKSGLREILVEVKNRRWKLERQRDASRFPERKAELQIEIDAYTEIIDRTEKTLKPS